MIIPEINPCSCCASATLASQAEPSGNNDKNDKAKTDCMKKAQKVQPSSTVQFWKYFTCHAASSLQALNKATDKVTAALKLPKGASANMSRA